MTTETAASTRPRRWHPFREFSTLGKIAWMAGFFMFPGAVAVYSLAKRGAETAEARRAAWLRCAIIAGGLQAFCIISGLSQLGAH